MQALSLGWHIVIVCFGVAFPAIVLFVEALYLRTGDPVYRTLAKRWSKAMLVLFAVGVVSGTILSFELGILWPEFMATFGDVFGLGFALEGFSFFVEAIFIAIYVYGWDRLPTKVHFLTGIPVAVAGVTGSLFVLTVNGWMNNPTGFRLEDGRAVNIEPWQALFGGNVWHELVHMLHRRLHGRRLQRRRRLRLGVAARQARPLPPHRPGGAVHDRRARGARAARGGRLGGPRGRRHPAHQARRDRGARRRRPRARRSTSSAGTATGR